MTVSRADVSVIIVNWNSREHVKRCIASILAHTRAVSLEVVVIDSGSFDGCGEMLREDYPQVRFIQSAVNLGFAKANNRAYEKSAGDYVLFLNPDTELAGPAIDVLHASFEGLPDAGVVGCTLLNADRTVQTSCVQAIPTIANQLFGSEFLMARLPRSRLWGASAFCEEGTGPREVEAVSGACLMVRRKTFEDVGRFSEDYFMYAEDMDLSYKCRQAGRRNYYVPVAAVVHYGGSSSNQAVSTFAAVMMREAIWRFLRKTRGGAYGMAYRFAMLGAALGRLAVLGAASMHSRSKQSEWAARRKWMAVLRWTVNRDGIVTQYYHR